MRGEQVRAARTMAGLTIKALAEAAGVSEPTVQRIDSTKGMLKAKVETVEAIRRVLEAKGVRLINIGDTAPGPGVCYAPPR